jgi:two-component system, OmpR family, sensor histidine kinase KdpD
MARGTLRIYLGAAPGVGKTFAMLNEGLRRARRGTNLVVGFVESHGRPNTEAAIGDLEVVPRRSLTYAGGRFEEMDLDAILARAPEVALVDELAHSNVPGSRHEKRWEDVEDLLAAGIDVISTLNVQHLESLNDVVERITGVKQHETIPDAVVRAADQLEVVDMTPEALRRRMAHGNIYPLERIDASLANYFRPGNLAALRELALLWVADRVEERLQQYLEDHGLEYDADARERVVVALTGGPGGDTLIRRAGRMAQRAKGDLVGVHVRTDDAPSAGSRELLGRQRRLLLDLGGNYHEVASADPGLGLVRFARTERATQLVVGASRRSRWAHLARGSVITRVVRSAGPVDVHVIATGAPAVPEAPIVRRPHPSLPPRRRVAGLAAAVVLVPVVTLVLDALRSHLSLSSVLLVYLLAVVGVAAIGGILPALLTAAAAFVLSDYYFTAPLHSLSMSKGDNVVALVVFVVVAAVVGQLVSRSARRRAEASRAQAEAETLARLSGTLLSEQDPLSALTSNLCETFHCESVAVLRRQDDRWIVEASAGDAAPAEPDAATATVPLGSDTVLTALGSDLRPDDIHVLHAFAGQLALAAERRRLRADAAAATGMAEANQLRTALLATVSHDLRAPLTSIKASVTGLRPADGHLTSSARQELLETIAAETDRLNNLVANLLDMSRLQVGALEPVEVDVSVDGIVGQAIQSLGDAGSRVVVDVPENLPAVHADPSLLARAVANVVAHGLDAVGPGGSVRIAASQVDGRVDLRVGDAADDSSAADPGEGSADLGLAVARGFVEAMHGHVVVEHSADGHGTVVLQLPAGAK